MYKPKTVQIEAGVDDYLASIADPVRRADFERIMDLMQEATHEEPKMWGTSIVGFGSYHYRYASGHEGDTWILGLSSRKNAITLYVGIALEEQAEAVRELGKVKTGKGCLYIRRLADVDLSKLKDLLATAAARRYGSE